MYNRLVLSVLVVMGLLNSSEAAQQQPNIVLIISDDQGWTDFGFMGHPVIKTPNLDKLAKQGVAFRRSYVPTALCRPSLTSLATGLYAHQSLITGNDPANTALNQKHAARHGRDPRELFVANIDKNLTVPRALAKHGYLSFQCGKWWEGSFERGGFSHGMTRGYPERGGRHGDDGLTIGRKGMKPVNEFIDTAIKAKKPFFLWYAPFLPHNPHNPPKRILKKYQQAGRPKSIANYFAMCDWFDETCGQLLDQLDKKGITKNTLVIFVSDNGWIQNPTRSTYGTRSKRSPHEGGVRTPILFRWPGKIAPANRPELCTSLDIVPTILAAAGVAIPKHLAGLNLLSNLQNGTPIERQAIFGEAFAHDVADIENPEASLLHRWVIRGYSKLILTYDGDPGRGDRQRALNSRPQLFDLKADPHEEVNLAVEQPELLKELRGLISAWYPLKERKEGVLPPAKKPTK